MLDQIKALLQEQTLERAVIVDDAFDSNPSASDLATSEWDRFFDDWSEDDEARVARAVGRENFDGEDHAELRRDAGFLRALWELRAEMVPAAELFRPYERDQDAKRRVLLPLQDLLETGLGLTCQTVGRDPAQALADAQILFLDLFLGFLEEQEAIDAAMARLKEVVEPRRDNPPIVVLLSESSRLGELGPVVRDEGRLLGCQFRMMSKSSLSDREATAEQIFELVTSRPDALKLNSFINAWDAGLDAAKAGFLRSVRTLDLADYANTHALTLDAEGEPLGDYVLDLFDLHLHGVLEGEQDLIRAAKSLNGIDWANYPPPQFMPSAEAMGMMDSAIFHNQSRTDVEAEIDADPKLVHLGDVFLAPVPAAVEGQAPTGERDVFLVLSQSCDLQHGKADRILLLKGMARPYRSPSPKSLSAPRTPIMLDREDVYVVDWDILAPETWLIDELPGRIEAGFRRVRRFRTAYALQLQQRFAGNLTRVGTMTAMPGRYPVGVKIWLRKKDGTAQLLAQAGADHEGAVCLVGRTQRGASKEWLRLSDQVQRDFAESLLAVPPAELPGNNPNVEDVRSSPEFYRLLKRGLVYKREVAAGTKPLSDTAFAVVQILPEPTGVIDGKIAPSFGPVLIETEWD